MIFKWPHYKKLQTINKNKAYANTAGVDEFWSESMSPESPEPALQTLYCRDSKLWSLSEHQRYDFNYGNW
ncbi:unnamed protein product [Medioppia subpectinata]|uniref:Uncharacterized protein n=1 Tax=Medioppia subpectinata TaxID=1979941 RepID=A0A7R9KEE2_9ACAR|nr:unnamed protein product [Medioppia subpectinata]CAG2101641.1 unnamed protein product [Medioppia subpectinata]